MFEVRFWFKCKMTVLCAKFGLGHGSLKCVQKSVQLTFVFRLLEFRLECNFKKCVLPIEEKLYYCDHDDVVCQALRM